jgi:LPXTG-site transpeptidase (sortase) family protein
MTILFFVIFIYILLYFLYKKYNLAFVNWFLFLITLPFFIFILQNFEHIWNIIEARFNKGKNIQNEFIKNLKKEELSELNKQNIYPEKLYVPKFSLEAEIINSNSDIKEKLNRWVINYTYDDLDLKKELNYLIVWHSSSKIKSEYDKIFINLVDLKKGDLAVLKFKSWNKIYKFKQAKIVSPEKLDELEKYWNSLFLITCYPFPTSTYRYVVEFEKYL